MRDLIERLEKASGPDRELDAFILCALAAPSGSKVEQSKFNGNWCIYEPTSGDRFRLWEQRGGWWRADGWPLTASIDAAVALVERVLPGWWWGRQDDYMFVGSEYGGYGECKNISPAIALCIALLRAKEARAEE